MSRGCDPAGTASAPPVRGRLFVPISLGNHFFSNRVLRRILAEVATPAERTLVVICDTLRLLSYEAAVRAPLAGLPRKVADEVAQFTRTLANCGYLDHPGLEVGVWSSMRRDQRFEPLLQRLSSAVERDEALQRCLHGLVAEAVDRFYGDAGRPLDEVTVLQRRYVLEETALSVFVTECLGYNVEVYRDEDRTLVRQLYVSAPARLREVLGGARPRRRFVALQRLFRDSAAAVVAAG